jgi:hypothetical protein
MIAPNTIIGIIDQLERLSRRIDDLTRKPDTDGMREFVQHRRDIANLFFQLSRLVEVRMLDLPEMERLAAGATVRSTLAEFRNALANLQADWPLPEIIANVDGYRRAKSDFNFIQSRFLAGIRSSPLATSSCRDQN